MTKQNDAGRDFGTSDCSPASQWGIRCPHCGTRKWDYKFRSPVDPSEDKFKCENGHDFKRYEEQNANSV